MATSGIIDQSRIILWFQPDGSGTKMLPFGVGEKASAMTGKSVPGVGVSPLYGRDEFGKPVLIKINKEAPGDLPSGTITFYERTQIDFLLSALQKGCPINIQTRITKCGRLNNPTVWDVLEHWARGAVTQYTPGDGPSSEFNGEAVSNEGSVSFEYFIKLVDTSLGSLVSGETLDILSIAGVGDEDCAECGNGYVGSDKIMYVGVAGDVGGTTEGTLLYTTDAGGTWFYVSAEPFAGTATDYESVTGVDVRFINRNQLRLIVSTATPLVGVKPQFAYADVTLGAEGTTTWTVNNLNDGVLARGVDAQGWLTFDRLYLASDGDIFLSIDQGETDPGLPIYTGATDIKGFAISPDENYVYAFGVSNLILREIGQNGIFNTRTGPSGGGTFYSLVIAGDGTIYAGNGTAIYKSTDGANTAGNWTELKDFGTNKAVKAIQVIGGSKAFGGDSQLIRAVVDDTTGSNGAVWLSVDGGATWQREDVVTNTGYNDAYFSTINDNLVVIVGDDGAIHRLAPVI